MHYKEIEPEDSNFQIIMVDLTHRCNMECLNCYLPNRTIPDMDVSKLYELLKRLPKRTQIRLIGAEPTLREDLPDIIYNVKKLGHRPTIVTNGLKLAHLEYCQQLKDAGLYYIQLSLNGADDDAIYKLMDNGKYANLKVRALNNIIKLDFVFNTGTILAKGVNEITMSRVVQLVDETMKANNKRFDTHLWKRVPYIIRFRSIGPFGRFMENKTYTLEEMKIVAKEQLNITDTDLSSKLPIFFNNLMTPETKKALTIFPYKIDTGTVYIRLTDWSIDEDGVTLVNRNSIRGRITPNWKLADGAAHVQFNGTGY